MSKLKRMVQILHKFTAAGWERIKASKEILDQDDIRRHLAVGQTFKFKSGDAYVVMPTGAVERAQPKPYRNKAERKRWLKERREDRGLSENEARIAKFKRGAK